VVPVESDLSSTESSTASFSVRIHQRKDEAGQATVEFALLLPLYVGCIAVLITSIGIGLSSLRLADTARVAARAASTSDNPSQTLQSFLQGQGIAHSESVDATQQFLTVKLTKNIRIPFLGIPIPSVEMSAQSTVLLEGAPVLQE
jgi:Flp pilus assembly protein TadG